MRVPDCCTGHAPAGSSNPTQRVDATPAACKRNSSFHTETQNDWKKGTRYLNARGWGKQQMYGYFLQHRTERGTCGYLNGDVDRSSSPQSPPDTRTLPRNDLSETPP
jgi:hypothetical protein